MFIDTLALVRKLPCIVCFTTPSDPHHLTTKGAGGKNTLDNLMPLCREHHVMAHMKGMIYMVENFKTIRAWLVSNDRQDILNRADKLL